MDKNEIKNQLIELQNDLILMNSVKEELWQYHPSNPQYVNVIQSYKKVSNIISVIENKINEINDIISTLDQLN